MKTIKLYINNFLNIKLNIYHYKNKNQLIQKIKIKIKNPQKKKIKKIKKP